ncbi:MULTISPECIES: urease accessory protein UreD [unclassified Arthrobacter]|uniref:urease accessory protein UreD n=1 Tax=unclassified Arthrobacter TaxID=235627 RepID=UPI0014914DF3|nr:urease accessory protein UreD [Arthrobacter sp. AET 35A]NOJ63610.1 urease accessory protein UreD [Arthrobacter sp. 147(2020)]
MPARSTRIGVELAGGRASYTVLDQGQFLAPRPVHRVAGRSGTGPDPTHARVALIGISMMLLGGDDVLIEVSVGAGVTLEVVEPAGLVAYNAAGVQARWRLSATVADGGTLLWAGAPLVVAEGANVLRDTRVSLAAGARLVLQEVLVRGRTGESPGELRSSVRCSGPAGDLLYEDLDLTGDHRSAVGVLGGTRVLGAVTALGFTPPALERSSLTRFDTASGGAVARILADSAHHVTQQVEQVFAAWR